MYSALARFIQRIPFGPLASVRRFKADPEGTQRRLLKQLLVQAKDTEWGRRLGFREIVQSSDAVRAYQETVPLHTYDDLRTDAKRMREGTEDVTWPGRFHHFAISSGTASEGKIIPLSQAMLARNRMFSIGTGLHYFATTARAEMFFGKHLTLPGRAEEDPNHPGTLVGEVSGLVAEEAPRFFQSLYQAVPNEIAFLENWEEKLDRIVEHAVDQDVRVLVMVPTWGLVLFERLIDEYNRRYNADASTVVDVWPNLQVFISGGVALRSYRELLEEQIGSSRVHFLETYGASEGFFSFQDELSDPAMLLHLDNGVFFEFVRLDEITQEAPRRYLVWEVEEDVRYAPYLTTCSGLWSYKLGDVVRFTNTNPHKILVAGRTSEMIDKYGEAVFGEEAREAVRVASEQTGALMTDFHVAPVDAQGHAPPVHQWLVEFEEHPVDVKAFADSIDGYLQKVNRHYQIRRSGKAVGAPSVVALPPGTFYRWLQEEKEQISGQTKVPRMSEERDVADRVLAIVGNNADPSP